MIIIIIINYNIYYNQLLNLMLQCNTLHCMKHMVWYCSATHYANALGTASTQPPIRGAYKVLVKGGRFIICILCFDDCPLRSPLPYVS